MPRAEDAAMVAVACRDNVLVFDGVLTRPVVASAWRQAQACVTDARAIDLQAVSRIDSAGMALLATLATRAGIERITGTPTGYEELRAAYRLDARLSCARG